MPEASKLPEATFTSGVRGPSDGERVSRSVKYGVVLAGEPPCEAIGEA